MGCPPGPWYIDDLLTWTVNTHTVSTGAATDGDGVPTYRIYEDETGTAILTGSMAKLDDASTTGFYSEQITLSAANGFEVGKSYAIYVAVTVNSVAATQSYNFKVIATAATAATVSNAVWDTLTAGNVDAGTFGEALFQANSTATSTFNLVNTEVADILAAVDTEVAAIKVKTDFLPSATAGAAGGLFIAGTNAATTITTALTTTFTGNLTGSVGSVTGAVGSVTGSVGSVTGAVGSVTGNVGGNVTGSVGTVNAFAANSITAAATAADFTTEVTAGLATSAALTVIDDFLDTEVAAILAAVDTEVAAIKTKTDFLPSATAGATGGLFIAGTNAATTITGSLTTTFTGNLTGSVASVTGAVGSVTGNVGGNVTGSVGTVNAFAANSITAASTAADYVTEIQAGLATAAALTTIDDFLDTEVAAIKVVTDKLDTALELDGAVYRYTTNALEQGPTGGGASAATIADAVWDEVLSGHLTAGTTGAALNSAGSGASAATIADAVWDEATSGHVAVGSFGKLVADTNTFVDTEVAAILAAVDTEVAAIKTKTDFLPSATAGASGGLFIAGTNAATAVTGSLTTTFTGNLSGSVASVTGNVAGNVIGSVGSVATDGITSASLATSAITEIQSGLATSAALTVVDDFLDTEVAAIKVVTDKLDTALVIDGAVYQFTANALELGPSGGGGSAADVWNEPTAGHVTAGTFGKLVADINAKTVNLPTDPADASDIAAAFGAIELAVDNVDEIATAVWAEATRTLTAIDEDDTTLDLNVTIQTALATQFDDLPTAIEIATEVYDQADSVETGLTLRQTMRLASSALFGEASGLGTTTATYRDFNDTKDRIVATVDDDGNRIALTLDPF